MANAAKKMPRGRPFQPGDDPRRNRGGKPKALLSQAVAETLSEDDARQIVARVIADAKAGDLQAVQMLWDRIEGKAVARNEQGEPGSFTGLEDRPTEELLRLVEKTA